MPTFLQTWPFHAALLLTCCLSLMWFNLVSNEVPEPYLDEFFHVPQAQKYCEGDYTWDPKITTPPGLYLVAKFFRPIIGCSTASLRLLNVGAICLIYILSYGTLRTVRTRTLPDETEPKDVKAHQEERISGDSTLLLDANTALNITLFPPLFFFSALFYTDVISTLLVLLSYGLLLRKKSAPGSISDTISAILVGVIALFFRQTNIFWVAVFPAGLTVIDALKMSAPLSSDRNAKHAVKTAQDSWEDGIIHDCAVQDAGLQDYVLLLLTVVLSALRKPFLVLQVAFPYLVLLGLFAGFVSWNGSVVLGDKSAHTATIHLPQMLYFWPYIAFFSAPLVIGPVLHVGIKPLPRKVQAMFESSFLSRRMSKYPDLIILGFFIVGATTAVHFNTIIHPYTLADNRHYVFYVFRILRQHPSIRYLAVPAYYTCAWLVTHAISALPNGEQALEQKRPKDRPTRLRTGSTPCQISFITIWLVTTALSVVTAPLVEPRYFIVPWIIWRLHVPSAPASLSPEKLSKRLSYDMRLGLETLWLLTVNAAVMYVFLSRGFAWPSEPDKVQRFLW